jgi:hypothetical protein
VNTDKIGKLYYAVALTGTKEPTFEELKNKGPTAYNTTKTTYGAINIDSSLDGLIKIDGLTSQTKYTVYSYLEDLKGQVSETIAKADFVTGLRYNAAEFQLTFK